MGIIPRKSAIEKELDKILKEEKKYKIKKLEKKVSFINRIVSDKVPEKLQETLEMAFGKAFNLIFTKGVGVIEKTYNKDKIEQKYQTNEAVQNINSNKKSIKAFKKASKGSASKNLAISGAVGIGTGLIGVGLPDIPVFTGMILKSIYEISHHYGYEHQGEKENYFILKIIEGAVACGDEFSEIDMDIDRFIATEVLPIDYSEENEIANASRCLSGELLYSKFVQGIPIVGAVGGAYDAIYMKRISSYAVLKYRHRYTLAKFREEK